MVAAWNADWRGPRWPLLLLVSTVFILAVGCGEPSGLVADSSPADSANDSTDELLATALAETITDDAYDPDTAYCIALGIVERLGGDELRALGWTPEVIRDPDFSLFLELDSEQYHVLDAALVDCVDAVDLSQEFLGVNADEIDSNCLEAALGSDREETVLRMFPTSPDYDAGLGMAGAALQCMDPVDFVSTLWRLVAPWYSSDQGQMGVEVDTVDRACIGGWLGDDQSARALTVFELVQNYRWIDDPRPLGDQFDRLNELQTTGELTAAQLDELNGCFAR